MFDRLIFKKKELFEKKKKPSYRDLVKKTRFSLKNKISAEFQILELNKLKELLNNNYNEHEQIYFIYLRPPTHNINNTNSNNNTDDNNKSDSKALF